MSTPKSSKPDRPAPADDKEARLAEALRANLKRRKAAGKKPSDPKTP